MVNVLVDRQNTPCEAKCLSEQDVLVHIKADVLQLRVNAWCSGISSFRQRSMTQDGGETDADLVA